MQHFIRFLFWFSLAWLILSLFGIGAPEKTYTDDIVLFAEDEVSIGNAVNISVLNNTKEEITVPNNCAITPLITEKYRNGEWMKISTARHSTENCKDIVTISASEKKVFSYENESFELFGEEGKYRISLENNGKNFSHEFKITPPGFFSTLWHTIIYKPIYNLLVWLIEVLPNHSLGFAIIALTIIVRIGLLLPNHKALKSQKALQKIQPELQKIKDKYKGDQAKIAQETMAVWKKHKVNPAGSCLPLLLQFPFLMALFFIIQDGLSPNNTHLLYDSLAGFDYTIVNLHFFQLDLTQMGVWYLAALVGGLQFIQMKLTFAQQKTNEKKSDVRVKGEAPDMMAMQMKMMNGVFTYVMPLMVAIFTLTLPAGVGLYWAVSTTFSIGQQQFVNKMMK